MNIRPVPHSDAEAIPQLTARLVCDKKLLYIIIIRILVVQLARKFEVKENLTGTSEKLCTKFINFMQNYKICNETLSFHTYFCVALGNLANPKIRS